MCDRITYCDVCECAECPKYGDDCDGDDDLISRADAIEAIQNTYCKPCKERGDDAHGVMCSASRFDDAMCVIDSLPSAEPTAEEVWSVAQKVFYSTLSYREAVDYLKELEKQHERFNQQSRCNRSGVR